MYEIFISLLGLFAGMLLAKIAPEELHEGKKYFKLLRIIIFTFLGLTLSYTAFYKGNIYFIISILVSITLILYTVKKFNLVGEMLICIFALISFFLFENKLLIASLFFLYNFPVGTLAYYEKKQKRS